MENMSDELIIIDKNGQYSMINKASKKHPFFDGAELTNLKNNLKEAENFDIDGNLIPLENLSSKRVARGEKFFKVIFQPLFDMKKQITEIVAISIDITKEMKGKNKVEEALKAQDEIFANVSHELKTPLNVIFSTNQLMELYFKGDSLETNKENIFKSINIIKQNCYRFTKLINNAGAAQN